MRIKLIVISICALVALYVLWQTLASFAFINLYLFSVTTASCILFSLAVTGAHFLSSTTNSKHRRYQKHLFVLVLLIGNIFILQYNLYWYIRLPKQANRHDIISEYYIKRNFWEAADFNKTTRVVVSLSTIPNRVHSLNYTLESLLNQTRKADAIYLNLPKFSNRLGVPYSEYDCPYEDVTVLETPDFGPLTKLLPAVYAETDPDTLIITVDDDRIYRSNLIEDLLFHAQRNPTAAIGTSGWSIMRPVYPVGLASVKPTESMISDHDEGFLLQGYAGIAYRRKFFEPEILKQSPEECFTLDDVYISGYLSTVNNVRKVTLASMEQVQKVGAESAKTDTTRLGYVNHHGEGKKKFLQCVEAIEAKFGHWETINY